MISAIERNIPQFGAWTSAYFVGSLLLETFSKDKSIGIVLQQYPIMYNCTYTFTPIKAWYFTYPVTGLVNLVIEMSFFEGKDSLAPQPLPKIIAPVINTATKVISSLAVGIFAKSYFKNERVGQVTTAALLALCAYNVLRK